MHAGLPSTTSKEEPRLWMLKVVARGEDWGHDKSLKDQQGSGGKGQPPRPVRSDSDLSQDWNLPNLSRSKVHRGLGQGGGFAHSSSLG